MGFDLGALQSIMNNLGLGNLSGMNQSFNDNLNIGKKRMKLKKEKMRMKI